jgi:katanin p60 ATPase-containing subunit A1
MQTLNRQEYEAKIAREKRENERRKNILIVMLKYLISIGYAETAFTLQEESKLDLEKFDIADNIDLYMIFCEYEDYFEMRFNKKPKFITQNNTNSNVKLPNIKNKNDKNINYGNVDKKTGVNGIQHKNSTAQIKKQEQVVPNNDELKLEVVGEAYNVKPNQQNKENKDNGAKAKFTFEDQKESVLLKPFPENMFGNNELKELALLVKK